ncbi:MAG: ANTAR domain-containing protein, partial [Streptomycetaceae bacterium]|nr:ANTAR domain-containing protein [Streptomycetaceae bacterium]
MTERPETPDPRASPDPAVPASAEAAVLAETVDRLREEVDGLRRALRSRGVIEQAKGLLMARMGCSADEAFGHLAQLSQHTNMKLVEVAAGLLGVEAPPEPPRLRHTRSRGQEPARHTDTVLPEPPGRLPVHPTAASVPRPPQSNVALSSEHAARFHLAASVLATATDADELARLLGREALAPLGADAVALAVLQPDGALRLAGTYGVGAQRVSQWQRIPPQTALPLTDAVRSGDPVRVRDRADADARYPHLG